jgi:hypothetical protein
MVALAAVSAAAAKRVEVVVRPGWREPVNLYAVVVLGSGNRKSAVVRDASAPLREHELAEARRLAPEVAAAETRRAIAEKARDKARDGAAKAHGDVPSTEAERLARDLVENPDLRVPVAPRLLVDDATPEKLAAMMAEHGGRMAVLSAAGGLFEVMAGRFSRDGKTPHLDLFLKAHSGDDLPIDRLSRPGNLLEAPALTLGLAVQPEVLRGLAGRPGFRGKGLLARILFALPESHVGHRRVDPPPVPEAVIADYRRMVEAVLALPSGADAWGEPRPRPLLLDGPAQGALLAFQRRLEPRLGDHGDLAHLADWGAKLAGQAARIAGLLHVAGHCVAGRDPAAHPVAAATMEDAIALAERFLVPHALAAFGEMGADPAVEGARAVLAALERWEAPTFSRRDLHQRSLKGRFPRPAQLEPPLAVLVDHGYVRPFTAARRSGPGQKPSPVFEINRGCARRIRRILRMTQPGSISRKVRIVRTLAASTPPSPTRRRSTRRSGCGWGSAAGGGRGQRVVGGGRRGPPGGPGESLRRDPRPAADRR